MKTHTTLGDAGYGYNRAIEKVLYSIDCAAGFELFFCPFSALNWFYRDRYNRAWQPLLEASELKDILRLGPISAKVILRPQYR